MLIIGILILVTIAAFYIAKRYLKKRNQMFKQNIVTALDMRESWKRSIPVDVTPNRFTEITDRAVGSELPQSCKYLSEI